MIVENTGQWTAVSPSPDGSRLVFSRWSDRKDVDELALVAVDGSEDRVLATRQRPERIGRAVWSPDGSTIVFQAIAADRQTRLVAVDVTGGSERVVADIGLTAPASGLTWMPDGSGLLIAIRRMVETVPSPPIVGCS